MNWDAIGAIGQMLGSLAVFITLGYLTVQVRHARDEVRRSIVQSRAEVVRDQSMTLATDARLANLTAKVNVALGGELIPFTAELVKRAGVSVEEATQLLYLQNAWWQIRAQTFRHLDLLPSIERTEFDAMMRRRYGGKSLDSLWYQTTKSNLQEPALTRYIDNLLAQPA